MRFLVCDLCRGFDVDRCEELRVCPKCGVSLVERAAAKRKMMVRRSADYTAVELENEISSSLFVPGVTLVHDAWDLLGYVEGQIHAINEVIAVAADGWERVGVVGFLTGSMDLLWLLRELIGFRLPKRVRITRGLSHKKIRADKDPELRLAKVLDEYAQLGVTRLVLVDEVVSGGQMNSGLKQVRRWLKHHGSPSWEVLAIGLTDVNDAKLAKARATIEGKGLRAWERLVLVRVPLLLAQDEEGVPVKTVLRIGTHYLPYRYWPGGYVVRCRNTLTTCSTRTSAAGHMAESYAATIRSISKENAARPKVQWPEKCCAECAERLARIRAIVATFPSVFEQESTVVGRVSDRNQGIFVPQR